jgi:hypothetical protein
MIANIQWLIDHKVIIAIPEGKPPVEDLQLASDTFQAFMDESDAPLVHILIDESKFEAMTISLKILSDVFGFLKHPRLGWVVMYGSDDQMKKFVSTMLTGMAKTRHRRFDTFEESLDFLMTMDSTLPTIQNPLDSIRYIKN